MMYWKLVFKQDMKNQLQASNPKKDQQVDQGIEVHKVE